MNDTCNVKMCDFCNKVRVRGNYNVYGVEYITNKQTYTLGLTTLCKYLNEYVLNKMYHLSPTQIILMRPDLLLNCIQEKIIQKKTEKVAEVYLIQKSICGNCYKEYVKAVPER